MILKSKFFEFITFHQRIMKKWQKCIFQKKLNKENREIISDESLSSRTEFLKVAILKNFGKVSEKRLWQSFFSNVAKTHPIISVQKSSPTKMILRMAQTEISVLTNLTSFVISIP